MNNCIEGSTAFCSCYSHKPCPTSLVGFAPGLYWGAHHQWANIRYLVQKGGTVPNGRLHTILQMQQIYTSCQAPRVLGGALPTQPDVTIANPHILTFGLVISVSCIIISLACVLLSLTVNHHLFMRMRQLTLLPLLFLAYVSIMFCTASIAIYEIHVMPGKLLITSNVSTQNQGLIFYSLLRSIEQFRRSALLLEVCFR